jgi:trans-aconitate methyltransferase
MDVTEARALIEPAFLNPSLNATWADLGCGTGTFTQALATLLEEGSKIYAVDKQHQQIKPSVMLSADLQFMKLDFVREVLPFNNLDGILMANALHYVKDKITFVNGLVNYLKPSGQILIVEYDTQNPNQWVPYPVSFETLVKTFSSRFAHIIKIGERNSIYKQGKMYACSMKPDL